jgi:hypothetical protein
VFLDALEDALHAAKVQFNFAPVEIDLIGWDVGIRSSGIANCRQ